MITESQNYKANVIVFLGPPASGKGTASSYFEKKFGIKSISPGLLFKKMRNEDNELAKLVKEATKDGGLCPTWLTNELLHNEVNNLAMQGLNIISLDGYPRTLEQLEFLSSNFNVLLFVHSDTDLQIIKKLVIQRRNCKICNTVFSVENPNRENNCCQNLDNWEKRWDDTLEMFEKRYNVYQKETYPIIEKIQLLDNYLKIDLINNINAFKEIEKFLKYN